MDVLSFERTIVNTVNDDDNDDALLLMGLAKSRTTLGGQRLSPQIVMLQ